MVRGAVGRDSLWTAYEALLVNSRVARDTLLALSPLQATADEPWRDAEPGKILHELRTGELARTRLIPHTPYYGTVDATPSNTSSRRWQKNQLLCVVDGAAVRFRRAMNLVWVAALALLVLAEKVLPVGPPVGVAAGVVATLIGLLMVVGRTLPA